MRGDLRGCGSCIEVGTVLALEAAIKARCLAFSASLAVSAGIIPLPQVGCGSFASEENLNTQTFIRSGLHFDLSLCILPKRLHDHST